MANEFHGLLVAALPQLRAYALALTRNSSAADDILQETAFRALRAQSQFTPGTNFKAWLFRILRNEYISSLRRGKRTPAPIDSVPEAFLSQNGNQEDTVINKEIMAATAKLPPGQRDVLLMVCGVGLSYEEVAETLNCSVGTVKSRLWRARHQMQALILGEEVAEGSDADAAIEAPKTRRRQGRQTSDTDAGMEQARIAAPTAYQNINPTTLDGEMPDSASLSF